MAPSSHHSEKNSKKILVCDDDPLFRKTLGILLRDYGTVTFAQNSEEVVQMLQARAYDLLLLDIQMRSRDEGLKAIPRIREIDEDLTLVMLSGIKDFRVVQEALRAGANDYLAKDFGPEEFKITLDRALGIGAHAKTLRRQNQEVSDQTDRFTLVGESTSIQNVRRLIDKFRLSPANVLITGETGTGKEIVARSLRRMIPNEGFEPFIAVDSSTLHAATAESALFGHEKGAFTGAETLRRGLFEEADDGILFFDEVANMPLFIQAKLLRVLQEKEIQRMGSNRIIGLNFRVVAATNQSLERKVAEGLFLPDLLQRLNILPITIDPLRTRMEDLPALIAHLLRLKGAGAVELSSEASRAFLEYSWPGNVRELSAFLDYSLAVTEDGVIDVADLHPKLRDALELKSYEKAKHENHPHGIGFYEKMRKFEGELLRQSYQDQGGNVSKMALALGIDRSHLYVKLKQHGIHESSKKSD